MTQIKWLTGIILPAVFIAMLLQACENDLQQVKQLSALEVNKPVDTTKNMDVIYSDSARVKARVLAPLMLHHTVAIGATGGFYEMPKGVKIFFYDANMNAKTASFDPDKHVMFTVVADYAITSNEDKLIELRKNVIVKNTAGDVFTTQQLFYDANKKIIYTKQAWNMNKVDGTIMDGTNFISNETFTKYHYDNGKGQIATQGNLAQ